MSSDIIKKMLDKMDKDPWHVKMKRKWRIRKWIMRANWRHYRAWIESKEYRDSYGDCECFKGNREIDKEYCKNNPKCNLRKAKVSYIDI